MKKSSVFLFSALLAFLLIWLWLRSPKTAENVRSEPTPTEAAPVIAAAKPIKAKAHAPKMIGNFQSKESGAKPEGNMIPFRVVNGQAIAFGDLILGEPEDSSIKEGFYEAPAPTLWERPEIPYAIRDELPNPERVKQAIEYFNKHTPVTFIPYDGRQPDAVIFEVGPKDCFSHLGKQGGLQPVKLDASCGWQEIAHEIMHVLGFVHEQSRPDRDKFLDILWPNIQDGMADQFSIVPENFMEAARQGAFDYHSIMLYSPDIFAKRGTATMRSRTNEPIQPSESGLSPGDIEKLRDLYRPYVK